MLYFVWESVEETIKRHHHHGIEIQIILEMAKRCFCWPEIYEIAMSAQLRCN